MLWWKIIILWAKIISNYIYMILPYSCLYWHFHKFILGQFSSIFSFYRGMESVMFLGSYLWFRKSLWEVDKCSEYFIIKCVILKTLSLPGVTKKQFHRPTSIHYQADRWWEKRNASPTVQWGIVFESMPRSRN